MEFVDEVSPEVAVDGADPIRYSYFNSVGSSGSSTFSSKISFRQMPSISSSSLLIEICVTSPPSVCFRFI